MQLGHWRVAIGLVLIGAGGGARAQTPPWPAKPIHVLVPFTAGRASNAAVVRAAGLAPRLPRSP